MDIGTCIADSWQAIKKYPVPIIVGSLLINLVNGVAQSILTGHAMGGMAIMALKVFRDEEPEVGDVFKAFDKFVDYLIIGLVIMLVGLLLCGVGVFVTLFLFLYAPTIVAVEDCNWKTALTKSKDLALANVGDTIVLFLAMIGVNIAGLLLCCVGLLVSSPLSSLMVTRAYMQLTGMETGSAAAMEPVPSA